ncbi:MAG TPA: hypothetical protein DCP68_04220 [Ruminococcus sp.]|nr:hypothetical protein [Ruminococcus sp.]
MRWSRAVRGSVTVFLVLILLPMVTYSTMIIDASRLQSVRTNIAGAGDLTLNAALSEYNRLLEEMYGVFANCKTVDEMKPALQSYFQQTVQSSLIGRNMNMTQTKNVTEKTVNLIMGIEDIPEDQRSDFLATELVKFACEPVEGSCAANPAVLKRQIIDYMKYRGPISIATGLLDKLSYMKNASAQTDVVDKKREFSDKYADFAEACRALMQKIDGEYNMSAFGFNQLLRQENGKYVMQTLLDQTQQDLQCATAFYLLNAHSPYFDSPLTYDALEKRAQSPFQSEIDRVSNMPEETVDELRAKLDAIAALRNKIATPDGTNGEFESKIEGYECTFEYDEDHPNDVTKGKATVEPFVPAGSLYPTADNIRSGGNGKWNEPFKDRQAAGGNYAAEIAYAKRVFEAQKAFKGNDQESRENAIAEYCYLRQNLEDIAMLHGTTFIRYNEALHDMLKENPNFDHAKIEDQETITEFVKGEYGYNFDDYYIEKEFSDKISESADVIAEPLEEYVKKVTNNSEAYTNYAESYVMEATGYVGMVVNLLETAKTAAEDASKLVDEVLKKFDDVEKKKKEWEKSIKKVDSSSTRSSMQSDFDSSVENVDRKEIEKLKNLLDKEIVPQIGPMIKEAKSIQYLGKSVYGNDKPSRALKDYTANRINNNFLVNLAFNGVSSKIIDKVSAKFGYTGQFPIPPDFSHDKTIQGTDVTAADAEAKAKELADNNFKTDGFKYQSYKRLRILDGLKENAGKTIYENEKLDAQSKKEFLLSGVKDPDEAFIVALYNIVGDGSEDQSKPEEMKQDDKSDYENIKRESDMNADKSEKRDTGEKKKTTKESENFGDIMSRVQKVKSPAGEEADKEYKVDKVTMKDKEKPDTGNSLSAAKDLLDLLKNAVEKIADHAFLEEYFTEMFTCSTDTLPDAKVVMLNGYGNEKSGAARKLNENTEWYGKEIEYILWGNSDLDRNILSNDGMIFLIRFALNAIYAFTAPDITSMASTIATPLAWIPGAYPIIYVAVILLIAMAESGIDVLMLHRGYDVAIYKSQQTFVCSPTGLLNTARNVALTEGKRMAEQFAEKAIEKGEQYVEKHLDEKLDSLSDSAKKNISEVADQFTENVDEFLDEQKKSVMTAIENQFVTPIINQVSSVNWLIEAGDRYGTASVDEMAGAAAKEALDTVYANAEKMNDGIVRKCVLHILSEENRAGLEKNVREKISEYFEGSKSMDLRSALTGQNGIITRKVNECQQILSEEFGKLRDSFTGKLNSAVDTTVADAKSFMHEQMRNISEQITGKAVEGIDSMFPESVDTDGMDTASSSGGITLNYKEYCKIFVLIGLIGGKETKYLQRASVLIEANMNHAIPADGCKKPAAGFQITQANTLFAVKAEMQMKTIFPWTVSDTVNTAGGNEGVQLDFSHLGKSYITINYCGVNGY